MEKPSVEAAPGVVIPRKYVIPPAVLAHRMERYAIYLIAIAFLLMAVNFSALSLEAVLWFASGLATAIALLCGVAVAILNGIAWNFERMKEELHGGREAIDMR